MKTTENNTLINEFVPYEVALTMKELGYDRGSFGCVIEDGFNTFNTRVFYNKNAKFPNYYDVPLYQQAFKFFREEYGLYPCIASYFRGAVFGIEDKNRNYHNKLKFNTHEEAELACLNKLIEIIKTK